jgi:hypothetical protein
MTKEMMRPCTLYLLQFTLEGKRIKQKEINE